MSKNALIVAHDPMHVPAFAEALHASGYNLVASGPAAEMIGHETEVPMQTPKKFLGKVGLTGFGGLPERSRHEVMMTGLAQCLAMTPAQLEEIGWPIIDLAYVNLAPPVATYGDGPQLVGEGGKLLDQRAIHRRGIRTDRAGITLIHAAIEGGRTVYVEPSLISEYANHGLPIERAQTDKSTAFRAVSYLDRYLAGCLRMAQLMVIED